MYNNYSNNRATLSKVRNNKCEIAIGDVELANGKLNRTAAAQDCNQLTVMHIFYAHLALLVLLKLLFNAKLMSCVCPRTVGDNVIIPEKKDVKKSVNDLKKIILIVA